VFYVQETAKLVPSRYDDYLEAAQSTLIPLYDDLGLRSVAFWETVPTQGYWPEVISLWEIDGLDAYGSILARQYSDGPAGRRFRAWLELLADVATSTHGLVMRSSRESLTLEQLQQQGISVEVCVHETVKTTPNMSRQYAEHVSRHWKPIAERHGRSMLGVYSVTWRNAEVINIWALDGWDALSKATETMPGDRDVWAWTEIAMSLRQDWDDRILHALPFSPLRPA